MKEYLLYKYIIYKRFLDNLAISSELLKSGNSGFPGLHKAIFMTREESKFTEFQAVQFSLFEARDI